MLDILPDFSIATLGTTLLIASQTEDTDVLWTLTNESFPFQQILMEKQVGVVILFILWHSYPMLLLY